MEPCQIRTCYQRDIDRIVHTKAFRRLMHKTQVFLQPEGDHYRTRMTHTLEVARIARTIARGLRLNEDLTEPSPWATTWATPLWPCGGAGPQPDPPRRVPPQRAVPAGGGPAGKGGRGPEPLL